ncbi:MAG: chromosomal replication initiator protein DnaA [Chloroflexota bacterium]|nr:chromosomal replication initiator protein DnaA [Chloroflexota bacterium]
MSRSAQQIWEAALGSLELQVTKANYQTWLRGTTGLSYDSNRFVVGAPNTFTVEWLEKRLRHLIKKNLSHIIGYSVEVEFEVPHQQIMENYVPPARSGNGCGGSSHMHFNPKYTFPSFIVGSCNRLAHAAATGVAENPGAVYNPLFLYGGAGLGKTHLLHAIGQFVQTSAQQVVYVTAEQFTNEFITGIREKSTEAFRNKYRSADVLLIDDIQFIAGKEQTQEGLFHTFNDLHAANRQVILSSDRPPKALSLLEDRLRSRFAWGLICDIQHPDLETRIAILQAKAAELKIAVPNEVLHLIARRIKTNIRELEGALNRVIAYSRLTREPVTEDLAIDALAEIVNDECKRTITPELIIDTSSEYFGISPDALTGKRRDKAIAFARQVAMYLMREELNSSWTDIGRALGGRDHSTVLHGHGKIASEIEASPALRRDILDIRETLQASAA